MNAGGRCQDSFQDQNDPASVHQCCSSANHTHRCHEADVLQTDRIARGGLNHDRERFNKFASKVCAPDVEDQQLDVAQSAA